MEFGLVNKIFNLPTFNLKQFGWNGSSIDATTALDGALDAVGEAGGGTIIFPEGETLIETGDIVKDFEGLMASINLVGAGGNSILKIRGSTTNKIEINNALSVTYKNLTILGSDYADIPNHFYRKLFSFGYCYRVHFEDVIFAGIRMANGDSVSSGAIYAYNSNLSLERVIAGGSAAPTKGFVTCERLLTLSVRNSQFLDYIIVGEDQWNLVNTPYAWLYTHDPVQQLDDEDEVSGTRTRVFLENVDFDEGATHSIVVSGNGEGGKTGAVVIKGCTGNIPAFGAGFRLEDVAHARIERSSGGLAVSGDIPGVYANNVDYLEINSIDLSAHVNHIHLLGTPGTVLMRGINELNEGATYPTGFRNEAGSTIIYESDTAIGAASSTNNEIPRFNGTGGKRLQGSGATIDDSGHLSVPGNVHAGELLTVNQVKLACFAANELTVITNDTSAHAVIQTLGVRVHTTPTTAGTTGARTINDYAGTINIAAGQTSIVLTNSLITANSLVIPIVRTNDTTMKSAVVICAAGSCTFYPNAAPTGEVSIGWIVINATV